MPDSEWVSDEDKALIAKRMREARHNPKPVTPKRDRNRSITASIRHGNVLHPWMLAYAEWFVTEPKTPSISASTAKASELSRARIHMGALRALEARDDFRAYIHDLTHGPVEAARAKYMNRLPKYVDAYDKAVDGALEANDYRALAQITEGALERIMPKKSADVAATQINITLQPRQQELLADLDHDVEVLEADVLAVEQHDSLD